MNRRPPRLLLAPWIALLAFPWSALPASAHPHVFVSVETTVVYGGGKISDLRHRWAFDEMYTSMAIQGLDTNGDGAYDKAELAELAEVNMEGLKEFGYFTAAKLGETALKFGDPKDYWLEFKDGVLALYFTLPLADAVLAEAEGFSFSVYDQTFFIAFDMAEKDPVKLAQGAPAGCAANVGEPQAGADDAQKLGDSFAAQLGGMNLGFASAKTVSIICPKS